MPIFFKFYQNLKLLILKLILKMFHYDTKIIIEILIILVSKTMLMVGRVSNIMYPYICQLIKIVVLLMKYACIRLFSFLTLIFFATTMKHKSVVEDGYHL